jgi:hypothetical protein
MDHQEKIDVTASELSKNTAALEVSYSITTPSIRRAILTCSPDSNGLGFNLNITGRIGLSEVGTLVSEFQEFLDRLRSLPSNLP